MRSRCCSERRAGRPAPGVGRCARPQPAPSDQGMVTAELAVVLPVLALVTSLIITLVAVAGDAARASDAARSGARSLSIGVDRDEILDRIRALAPAGTRPSTSPATEPWCGSVCRPRRAAGGPSPFRRRTSPRWRPSSLAWSCRDRGAWIRVGPRPGRCGVRPRGVRAGGARRVAAGQSPSGGAGGRSGGPRRGTALAERRRRRMCVGATRGVRERCQPHPLRPRRHLAARRGRRADWDRPSARHAGHGPGRCPLGDRVSPSAARADGPRRPCPAGRSRCRTSVTGCRRGSRRGTRSR